MQKKFFQKMPRINLFIGKVSLREKALFAKHLAIMIKAGLTISESLEVVLDTAQGSFKRVLKGILKSNQSGESLSDSMARYPKIFSRLFISAIKAGESSGTLDESLQELAVQLEKENNLSTKIRGALLYPSIVLIAATILGFALVFFILPKITPIFEGLKMDLPITTVLLIKFSYFIKEYGSIIIPAFFGGIIFLYWFFRRKFMHPITHFVLLKLPIVKNISKNANLAKFCRTFGTLLKSGLNIDESLEITGETMSNYYYCRSINKTAQSIKQGSKISDNLKKYSNLFPSMVISMIRVGEESGGLEESLFYLSSFYESEVDNASKSLATTIEPILLLCVGLAVGFLALAIITPIYSITSGINK